MGGQHRSGFSIRFLRVGGVRDLGTPRRGHRFQIAQQVRDSFPSCQRLNAAPPSRETEKGTHRTAAAAAAAACRSACLPILGESSVGPRSAWEEDKSRRMDHSMPGMRRPRAPPAFGEQNSSSCVSFVRERRDPAPSETQTGDSRTRFERLARRARVA